MSGNHEHHNNSPHSEKNHEETGHGHTHGAIDATLATTSRGIWAIKWSFIGLSLTSLLQLVLALFTSSVALFADTIHNFGDAATAVPLLIAFLFARKKSNKTFTYGYGKMEDIAGVIIVVIMFVSALIIGYEAINRFFNPESVKNLWMVVVAALIGFIGNEAVAQFRIKVGKEIHSEALIADGYHARTDGYTSLAIVIGAAGVFFGFPLADPLIGLVIMLAIFRMVWQSGKSIFTRLLDGVDPKIVDGLRHAAEHVAGVKEITDVRVRWMGHRILVDLGATVDGNLTISKGHEIAGQIHNQLREHLPYLANASIHIDPPHASGEKFHSSSNELRSV